MLLAVVLPSVLPAASLITTMSPASAVPVMGLVVPAWPVLVKATLVEVSMVNGVPLVVVAEPPTGVTVTAGVYVPSGSVVGTLMLYLPDASAVVV